MPRLLISDTNSAIKLAFWEDKVFQDGFTSIGTVCLSECVVRKEVKVHKNNPEKQRIASALDYLLDCEYYYDFEFDDHEFWTYQSWDFEAAKEDISEADGFLNTSDEDEEILYMAIVNDCHIITNEYALRDLARFYSKNNPNNKVLVYTAEDIILKAYDEEKVTKEEVQKLLNDWADAKEFVISFMKKEFLKREFSVPVPQKR